VPAAQHCATRWRVEPRHEKRDLICHFCFISVGSSFESIARNRSLVAVHENGWHHEEDRHEEEEEHGDFVGRLQFWLALEADSVWVGHCLGLHLLVIVYDAFASVVQTVVPFATPAEADGEGADAACRDGVAAIDLANAELQGFQVTHGDATVQFDTHFVGDVFGFGDLVELGHGSWCFQWLLPFLLERFLVGRLGRTGAVIATVWALDGVDRRDTFQMGTAVDCGGRVGRVVGKQTCSQLVLDHQRGFGSVIGWRGLADG